VTAAHLWHVELQQIKAGCSRSYVRHQRSSQTPPQPPPTSQPAAAESSRSTRSHHQLTSKPSRTTGVLQTYNFVEYRGLCRNM